MNTNMYVEYEHLVRQQKQYLAKLKSLENCLKNVEPKHCYLNLSEKGQWFVELSGEKAKEIIVSEMMDTKVKLNEMTLKVVEELEKIVAKSKMIEDALEGEQVSFKELFGETE